MEPMSKFPPGGAVATPREARIAGRCSFLAGQHWGACPWPIDDPSALGWAWRLGYRDAARGGWRVRSFQSRVGPVRFVARNR